MLKNIIKNNNLIRCSNCVMPLSRPRMQFNSQGICNACQWSLKKKED